MTNKATTHTLKNWLLGATLAGATAMSVGGWAMGHKSGMEHDPGRMLSRMSEKLELSSEQQAGVEKLLTESRQASEADRKRLKTLRAEIGAQRTNFDPVAAQQIAGEIGQITSRMVYRASETWAQVYQLLDAGQKAELDTLMAQRESRRSKWHRSAQESSDG
jgi:Spy/CpxP family protein refolding chaperone